MRRRVIFLHLLCLFICFKYFFQEWARVSLVPAFDTFSVDEISDYFFFNQTGDLTVLKKFGG